MIVVPIGGGSGAAGACIVAKAIRPEIEVIGVQSEAAPAAFRSWQARALLDGENATFAEGLATRVPFELPQQILWEQLDDFVLVGEDEIRQATRLMIEHTRNLVEPAGAAPLAAALKLRDRLPGQAGRARRERRQHQPGAARGALPLTLDGISRSGPFRGFARCRIRSADPHLAPSPHALERT